MPDKPAFSEDAIPWTLVLSPTTRRFTVQRKILNIVGAERITMARKTAVCTDQHEPGGLDG
jgi:hypothetical protein